MKSWMRYGLVFGVIAAVTTLTLNLMEDATIGPACQGNSPLAFVAFLVFLLLMGGAGFMTTRSGDTVGMAALAGLLGALVSGVATIIAGYIIFTSGSCGPTNSTTVALATVGILAGIFLSLFGLGFGPGAGAIGGFIGRSGSRSDSRIDSRQQPSG